MPSNAVVVNVSSCVRVRPRVVLVVVIAAVLGYLLYPSYLCELHERVGPAAPAHAATPVHGPLCPRTHIHVRSRIPIISDDIADAIGCTTGIPLSLALALASRVSPHTYHLSFNISGSLTSVIRMHGRFCMQAYRRHNRTAASSPGSNDCTPVTSTSGIGTTVPTVANSTSALMQWQQLQSQGSNERTPVATATVVTEAVASTSASRQLATATWYGTTRRPWWTCPRRDDTKRVTGIVKRGPDFSQRL